MFPVFFIVIMFYLYLICWIVGILLEYDFVTQSVIGRKVGSKKVYELHNDIAYKMGFNVCKFKEKCKRGTKSKYMESFYATNKGKDLKKGR